MFYNANMSMAETRLLASNKPNSGKIAMVTLAATTLPILQTRQGQEDPTCQKAAPKRPKPGTIVRTATHAKDSHLQREPSGAHWATDRQKGP